jgi:hypothetical protein
VALDGNGDRDARLTELPPMDQRAWPAMAQTVRRRRGG